MEFSFIVVRFWLFAFCGLEYRWNVYSHSNKAIGLQLYYIK